MTYPGWQIRGLRFTGEKGKKASLSFGEGLSLVYGASNTGKTFAVKSLDFMMGAGSDLPNIRERELYEKAWLDIAFGPDHLASLERAINGGAFNLHDGQKAPRTLYPKHDAKNPANISTYLLSQMGAEDRKVAVDTSGTLENLTFRDIAHIVLTNEIAIQSEKSPVESREREQTRERSVLKFMLTGQDDSAVIPMVKPKDFRTGRSAKAAVLQDMIVQIDADISKEYSDTTDLIGQNDRINETLSRISGDLDSARSSIRSLLDDKRRLSVEIGAAERRSTEIWLSLDSFNQLKEVYDSDIARLELLEEAGFLLGLDGKRDCPVCGAAPEAQAHSHGLVDIEDVRAAAEVEIQKIKLQREDLIRTIRDTHAEAERLTVAIDEMRQSLATIEAGIADATPQITEQQRKLTDVVFVRDHVRRGLDLLARRTALIKQKDEIEASRPPKRNEPLQLGISTQTAKGLSDVVTEVLMAWGFPGRKQVVFDLGSHDLIIDGKERKNNGKGVRAITHAAFKVALMLYCREHTLPHPGFLVLDTPLLTYRDPLIKKNEGPLSDDEKALSNTDLRDRFFEHLGHLGKSAQFIVFENVDPPKDIKEYAAVETFTNDPNQGRQGLF